MKKTRTADGTDGSGAYGRARRILAGFTRWIFRVEVIHPEREPAEPYLLCANHLSAMDPVILCVMMQRQLHFLSKKELFHIPVLSGFLRAIGCLPVDRSGDVGAIRTTVELLQRGATVGIFPQGTRCAGREVESTAALVKSGPGLLVCKTGVQVLPVRLLTKGNRVRPFRRVTVVVGEPMHLFDGRQPGERGGAAYERVSREIFGEICRLGAGEERLLP